MTHDKKRKFDRVYLVYAFLLLFAFAIVVRIAVLVFVQGDKWKEKAQKQSYKVETVHAIRGNIYSRDTNLIATSVPIFTIRIDLHKSVIPIDTFRLYLNPLSDSLSRMFPAKSKVQYKKMLTNGRAKGIRSLKIAQNINYTQLQRIKQFPILKKGQFKGGLIVEEKEFRYLPYNDLASRTIGYYKTTDGKGVGIESAFNKELAGISGKRLVKKVANDIWRPVYSNNQIEPENGKDIITTIDIRIQDVAEAALMRCLLENEAEHGCAILMEVVTGEIRAIANLKRGKDGKYSEALNYAIQESAEPGSTFKLASSIAILEDGKYDTSTLVPTGIMAFHGRNMIDSKRGGYGEISFKKAFEKSSNVGISYLAYDVFHQNPKKFTDYLYKMGLNEKLGLELAGEGAPYIKNPKSKTWSKISLPWMSIGYELRLTPIHQLALYNAVANNGKMMKPYFIKEIKEGNNVIRKNEPVVLIEHICSKKTIDKMKGLLEGVVTEGTARSLSHSPYKVAGKTGTAQINYGKKGVEKMMYRASFAGYFPADNPMYSCIVIITNPQKNKKYGGEVSAPVFREIADKVYATLLRDYVGADMVRPMIVSRPEVGGGNTADIRKVYSYLNIPAPAMDAKNKYVRLQKEEETQILKCQLLTNSNNSMPNVIGLGARDAIYLLERQGLQVRVYGKGSVVRQSMQAGEPIHTGAKVSIELL
ncbi:MAG: penicillin-binding protein [Bacteroidales bacterium]